MTTIIRQILILHLSLFSLREGTTHSKEQSIQRLSVVQHLVDVSQERIGNSVVAPGSTVSVK